MILSTEESVSSSVAEADGLVEKMRKEMNLIKGVKVLEYLVSGGGTQNAFHVEIHLGIL